MIEQNFGRTTELRAKFERRYRRLLPHFVRAAKSEPDAVRYPGEHKRWLGSKEIVTETAMEDTDKWWILSRLATPIWERLNQMREWQEKTGFIESPTNAKQTVRAIAQLDRRIDELKKPTILNETGDDGFYLQEFLIENLEAVRESGGFRADGTWIEPSEELSRQLDDQIRELRDDPGGHKRIELERLERRKGKYIDLLPNRDKVI